MSRRTKAVKVIRGWAKRTAFANRSRTNRMNTGGRFVNDCYRHLMMPIDGPEDITPELLKLWVAYLVTVNTARTIQNKLNTVRRILEVSGHEELANSPELRSRALGAPEGSRDGTNTAISNHDYQRALRIAARSGEPGLGPILMLERTIGLRRQEAVMSGPWLEAWERLLLNRQPLPVTSGTKNGRPRVVTVPDPEAALRAVRAAREVAGAQGGNLIDKPTLREALARYSNLMTEWVGVKGHSLRYAFAKDLFYYFLAMGKSEDEAWPLVSDALGHGLNREDLMRCVYLKGIVPRKLHRFAKGQRAKA